MTTSAHGGAQGKPGTADTSPHQIADLRYQGNASGEQLSALRRELVGWATLAGLSEQHLEAVALAGYEALANAFEHAYPGQGDGLIDLHAAIEGARLTITVTDWGRWREPPADPGTRGRGLVLIRNLCTHADIAPTGAGTTVTMVWDLDTPPED